MRSRLDATDLQPAGAEPFPHLENPGLDRPVGEHEIEAMVAIDRQQLVPVGGVDCGRIADAGNPGPAPSDGSARALPPQRDDDARVAPALATMMV